jgi:hypothetical protein
MISYGTVQCIRRPKAGCLDRTHVVVQWKYALPSLLWTSPSPSPILLSHEGNNHKVSRWFTNYTRKLQCLPATETCNMLPKQAVYEKNAYLTFIVLFV